jgi:hypothetical protein
MAHGVHVYDQVEESYPPFWRRWFYSTNHKDIGRSI